ncbi:MAG: hypothetical protein AAB433_01745 [Nitrospirota bacterium]
MFDRLVVVAIEHHLDVIKNADWVIGLGPEGGDHGSEIVAEGPPREIAKSKRSYTGQVLKEAGLADCLFFVLTDREKRQEWWPGDPLLAERAQSECARSMRAGWVTQPILLKVGDMAEKMFRSFALTLGHRSMNVRGPG